MANTTHGLHHFHKRKRIHVKHEPYPHPNKWKRFLDKTIYVVGVAGPIMTIPQVIKIWVHQNAAGVSLASWTAYGIIAAIWLVYGIVHRTWPIVINYSIWIFFEILIVIGIILYG